MLVSKLKKKCLTIIIKISLTRSLLIMILKTNIKQFYLMIRKITSLKYYFLKNACYLNLECVEVISKY